MSKKYGGVIHRWFKEEFPEFKDAYGPSLGFVIHGILGEDPTNRGFGHQPIRTSLVVKWDCGPLELLQIETLNTIYDLAEER